MKHSLENISEESCNGCGACYQKCPKQCIRMVENDRGFLIPQIGDGCVSCGLCVAVCPEKKNSSRIRDYLTLIGLESRIFYGDAPVIPKEEIDYTEVDPKIRSVADESKAFLQSAIDNERVVR